jgi:predicted nucleic acid-binding protein
MTRIYVGPTVLHSLGQIGELPLLTHLDGRLVIPEAVTAEVDSEPARTGVAEFLEDEDVSTAVPSKALKRAMSMLDTEDETHEAAVLAGVLAHRDSDDRTAVAVLSEDTHLRALAHGLGATVTSSYGVVARAAIDDKYLSPSAAKRIIRRTDKHGLHMTGELRERAVGEVAD